jgi:hypothetical protein
VKKGVLAEVVKASTDAVYGAQDISSQADPQQQRQARTQLYGSWLRGRSTLETPMLVYFDESDAADHWRGRGALGFRNAVLLYILMACCDPGRARHVEMLEKYLAVPPEELERLGFDPWEALRCGPGENCTPAQNYKTAYTWLGNQLFAQTRTLRDQLLAANAEGFSTDWRDLISDLNPLS